jgi:GH18 family chitinase
MNYRLLEFNSIKFIFFQPNPYNFTAESIDPHLCTHIIYAFGKVSGNTIKPYEWNDESDQWSTGKIFYIKFTLPLIYLLYCLLIQS